MSRLGCQAIVSNRDVTIEIPKYTINHARENHWRPGWRSGASAIVACSAMCPATSCGGVRAAQHQQRRAGLDQHAGRDAIDFAQSRFGHAHLA
jgi:hypothetical protein